MKRIIVGFTEETKTRVLQELKLHMKHELIDEDAAILEVFDRVNDPVGSHDWLYRFLPTYEISSYETKSGESVRIGFLANDFIYEKKGNNMNDNENKIWAEFSEDMPFGDRPDWMMPDTIDWPSQEDDIDEAIRTMIEDSKIEDDEVLTYDEIRFVVDLAIDEHNFKRKLLK